MRGTLAGRQLGADGEEAAAAEAERLYHQRVKTLTRQELLVVGAEGWRPTPHGYRENRHDEGTAGGVGGGLAPDAPQPGQEQQ